MKKVYVARGPLESNVMIGVFISIDAAVNYMCKERSYAVEGLNLIANASAAAFLNEDDEVVIIVEEFLVLV